MALPVDTPFKEDAIIEILQYLPCFLLFLPKELVRCLYSHPFNMGHCSKNQAHNKTQS